jgi:hypothetical protein
VTQHRRVQIVNKDTVLVDVVGNGIMIDDNMSTALSNDGFSIINCYKNMCSMYVPINKLMDLANLDYIHFLRPALSKAKLHAK